MSAFAAAFPIPFGGGDPTLKVVCVKPINKDYLSVEFSDYVRIDAAITNTSNYVFTSLEANQIPLVVEKVFLPKRPEFENYTNRLYLYTNLVTMGSTYRLTISNVFGLDGVSIADNTFEFMIRETKEDHCLESFPLMYSRDITSTFRHLINGLTLVCDELAGSADDDLLDECPDKYNSIDTYYDYIHDPF